MALALEAFTKSLLDTGLLSAEELEAVASAAPGGRPQDAQALAKELIRTGKLTRYQAANVLEGRAKWLVFGEYVVLDKIGAGGMGQVFKARHRRMGRVVALKVLPPSATKSPDAAKRFQREVQAAARLEHPNIVTAYDAGEANGVHFLAMQYVDGQDLASLVKSRGPLPPAEAIGYVRQAAAGLAYAHAQGIIHRDIKPANLLLDKSGIVKILDMGLARLDDAPGAVMTAQQDGLTHSGQVMGTVDYMAPEQAMNTHAADARSDIYSLGCTLYRLLTGENLFGGTTLVEKIVAHREQSAPLLTSVRADLPPALDEVFRRLIAKRPEDRYQTMTEVVSALDNYQTNASMPLGSDWQISTARSGNRPLRKVVPPEESTTGDASGLTVATTRPRKRGMSPLVLVGIGAVIVIAVAVGIFVSQRGDKQVASTGGQTANVPPVVNTASTNQSKVVAPASESKSVTQPLSEPVTQPRPPALPDLTPNPSSAKPPAPPLNPIPPPPTDRPGPPPRPEPPPAPTSPWFDVLAMIDPMRDVLHQKPVTGNNQWQLRDSELRYVPDGKAGKLKFPIEIHGSSYELQMDVVPLDDGAVVTVDLPAAKGMLALSVAFDNGIGIGSVDNGPSRLQKLPKNQPALVGFRLVRKPGGDEITVLLDGKSIIEWSGNADSLLQAFGRTMLDSHSAGLFLWGKPVAFRAIRMRVLDGELRPLSGPKGPPPMPPSVTAIEPTTPSGKRLPRPATDALAAAQDRLNASFKDRLQAATRNPERVKLAEEFVRLALTSTSPDERYVLFENANRLAVEGQDLALGLRTSGLWDAAFEIDREAIEKKTISGITEAAKTPAERKDMAMAIVHAMDDQLDAERYDTASRLLDAGLALLAKAREPAILKELKTREVELKEWLKLWSLAQDAKTALAAKPDDAAAHVTLGRYLCLVRSDWPSGLDHLTKGNDDALRAAAQKELSGPTSPEAQAELGEAWWAIGEKEKEKASPFPRIAWQDHAAGWIRQAIAKLPSARTRLQPRLTQLDQQHKTSGMAFSKRHPLDVDATFNGHFYKFYHTLLSWKEAKARCEALGGHLVIIDNREENDFIRKLVARDTPGEGDFNTWIGASDEQGEGKYVWIDGSPMTYADWMPNKPTNVDEGFFVAYWAGGGNVLTMKWHNCPLRFRGYFVCEWKQ